MPACHPGDLTTTLAQYIPPSVRPCASPYEGRLMFSCYTRVPPRAFDSQHMSCAYPHREGGITNGRSFPECGCLQGRCGGTMPVPSRWETTPACFVETSRCIPGCIYGDSLVPGQTHARTAVNMSFPATFPTVYFTVSESSCTLAMPDFRDSVSPSLAKRCPLTRSLYCPSCGAATALVDGSTPPLSQTGEHRT